MTDLIAIKALTYAGRRIKAGEAFASRSNRDGQILVAVGKARRAGKVPAPAEKIVQKFHPLDHDQNGKKGGSKPQSAASDALKKLRADYTEVVGKKPHHSWGEAELQRRIDAALAG